MIVSFDWKGGSDLPDRCALSNGARRCGRHGRVCNAFSDFDFLVDCLAMRDRGINTIFMPPQQEQLFLFVYDMVRT